MTSPTNKPPSLPAGASFPQPVTAEEKTATGLFLEWLATLMQDDKVKTQRLQAGAQKCAQR